VITVAGDAPACGTIAEKVPVLREVSFTMHLDEPIPGYAKVRGRETGTPSVGLNDHAKDAADPEFPCWTAKRTKHGIDPRCLI
jgi:hypothetical protein